MENLGQSRPENSQSGAGRIFVWPIKALMPKEVRKDVSGK